MRIDFGLVLGVFLELIMLIYFSSTTLSPRKNYFTSIIITVVGYILIFVVSTLGHVILNNPFCFIIIFFIFILGYKINISNALLLSGILVIFDFLGESLMMFLLGLTFNVSDIINVSPEKSLLVTIGGKLIYFIGILIMRIIKKGKDSDSEKSLLILMVVPIITITSIWLIIGLDLDRTVFVIFCVIFLCANIMIFVINEYITSKNKRIRNLEIENAKNHLELEEYKHININYEENRLFRHDLKEHLTVLKSLISENSTKAIEYMKKIEDISDQTKIEKYSDNPILNILLIQKSRECKSKGIKLNIKSTNPYINFLDDVDIIAIFSNLINNAIEACAESEERNIFFDFSMGNGAFIVIKIENSCDIEPIVSNGILKTRKGNMNNHGIGMRSITNALDKYNGNIDWKYNKENRIFRTIILLNTQQ